VNLPYAPDLYPVTAGLQWLARIDGRCLVRSMHHASCNGATFAMLRTAHGMLVATALAAIALGAAAATVSAAILQQRRHATARRPLVNPDTGRTLFQLVIGRATGRLLRIGHGAGVAAKTALVLRGDDASQNIAIFGGIGSGKTTRSINRLVAQALVQQCGILAFDIKGDYYETLRELARRADRPLITIGVRARGLNLLEGLTPEVAASFLKSALLLGSGADSKFWIETGTELARNVLAMLRFLPEAYSLNGLYRWLFDEDERERLSEALQAKLDGFASPAHENERRLLLSSLHYYRAIFAKFEDKVRSNVLAELAQVLSPFAQPELADAFCTSSPDNVQMETTSSRRRSSSSRCRSRSTGSGRRRRTRLSSCASSTLCSNGVSTRSGTKSVRSRSSPTNTKRSCRAPRPASPISTFGIRAARPAASASSRRKG